MTGSDMKGVGDLMTDKGRKQQLMLACLVPMLVTFFQCLLCCDAD